MPESTVTQAELDAGHRLCDDLIMGGHSWDGAAMAAARTLSETAEAAVFDFLNWLTAQNIELTRLTAVGYVLQPMGHLLERWKTERKEA